MFYILKQMPGTKDWTCKTRLAVFFCLTCYHIFHSDKVIAQDHEFRNWYAWFNNVKINQKWGINNDVQFRAGRNWSKNSLFLIRAGADYYVSNNQTASLGYATTINTHSLGVSDERFNEHRIWQQYIVMVNTFSLPIQHRFRFEQRFLNRSDETVYAMRFRYFFRTIIPLNQSVNIPFEKGFFTAAQNEVFLNTFNNIKLNGNFFDKNRAYLSFGYRFSKKYDMEVGYMNEYLKTGNRLPNIITHIFQAAIYTNF